MNGIIINDKQYIYVESMEKTSCVECDLCTACNKTDYPPCLALAQMCRLPDGVFKELKVEK